MDTAILPILTDLAHTSALWANMEHAAVTIFLGVLLIGWTACFDITLRCSR